MKLNTNLSIDIGGTKIRVIEYDDRYRIKNKLLLKTEVFFKENREDLENLLIYLRKRFKKNSFFKIGISMNSYIKDNKIIYSSLLGGKVNIDLKKILDKYFTFPHFNADNDVICAAKAELKFGFGKKYNSFSYINIGTGIRVVNVYNCKLVLGINNLAGEISTIKIYHPHFGFISYEELLGGKHINKVYSNFLPKNKTFKNKVKDYFSHLSFVKNYLENLVVFLSIVSHFYDPEVIILGGSVTFSIRKYDKLLKEIYNKLEHHLFVKNILYSSLKFPENIGALL